jgi:hypothetical protein
VFGSFTKKADLASGCGINSKGRKYQNFIAWIMLPAKIHCRRVVTVASFRSSLLWKLYQIFDCPFKLNFFNLLGLSTKYNNILVSKNIIFSKGPNTALWRYCVCSHDQLLHQINFDVSSYFRLSFFNVDSDLLLLSNMHSSKAFQIHCVKVSSLTNKRYIPTFLLQCLVHLLPHTPYQHNCHLSQTKMVNTYNEKFLNFF